MSGEGVLTPVSSKSDTRKSVLQQRASTCNVYCDKENLNTFGQHFGENQRRSPLPVNYPRKPLNDITAILQSLDDDKSEAGARSMKPRKPFTRSQKYLGTCSQKSYELLETNDIASIQSRSRNQDKERSKAQFATKACVKKKSCIPTTVSLFEHNQENREPNTHSLSKKKTKPITSSEAGISSENANHVVLLPVNSSSSNNVITVEALCSDMGAFEGGEVHLGVPDDVMIDAELSLNITHQIQQELKSDDSPSTSSMTEASHNVQQTPQVVNPAEAKDAAVCSIRRDELARRHKKHKTLMTRSSVAKFR